LPLPRRPHDRAYRTSSYRVGDVAFRLGRRTPALDATLHRLHASEAVLLTACNPHSRRMPSAWNARMMRALAAITRRRRVTAGESGAGRWREAQLLVAGPAAWATSLARRFRQNAVVVLRRRQPPRLLWVAA
jgi:hypothetical protein